MNSKILFVILFFILAGCGVKARPVVPPEKAVNSYIESFTDTPIETPVPSKKKK